MTLTDKQIKLLEAMGWKQIERTTENITKWPVDEARKAKIWFLDGYGQIAYWVPQLFNSLDAMHEAERIIAPIEQERNNCDGKWVQYGENLCKVCGYDQHERVWFSWVVYHATATQRFEALGRALGLWKEGE